jgi:recombination protein RecA
MPEVIVNSWIYAALIISLFLFCIHGADFLDLFLRKLTDLLPQNRNGAEDGPGKHLFNTGEGVPKMVPISTGVLSLDLALGTGGLPRGCLTEIYGRKFSGKTTLMLHAIAETQKMGGVAAFIDTGGHVFDPLYAQKIGVNVSDLIISTPNSAEQAFKEIKRLVISSRVDLVIINSLADLVFKAELENKILNPTHVSGQVHMISHELRQLKSLVSATTSSVVFFNQLQRNIGILFSQPERTPGGLALKFYSSVRIDMQKVKTIKQGDVPTGAHIHARVVKNKFAAPNRNADLEILNDQGISTEGYLIDMGVKIGLLKKIGPWLVYKTERIGQSRESAKEYFKKHKDKAAKMETELRGKLFLSGPGRAELTPVREPEIYETK